MHSALPRGLICQRRYSFVESHYCLHRLYLSDHRDLDLSFQRILEPMERKEVGLRA